MIETIPSEPKIGLVHGYREDLAAIQDSLTLARRIVRPGVEDPAEKKNFEKARVLIIDIPEDEDSV